MIIRSLPHAVQPQRLDARIGVALDLQPAPAHHPEHPEEVQHRQLDSVRGQYPEAGEIRLILELECPGERALEVDRVLLGQVERAGVSSRGVAGIERAVAIGVLGKDRCRAGRTAVGIGFADDDRTPLELRKAGNDLEPAIDILKLGGNSHLDVPGGDSRRALGVERQEIEWGADLARGVVGSAQAVLDKVAEEPGRLREFLSRQSPARPRVQPARPA